MAGLSAAGFTVETLSEILASMQADYQSKFGPVDVSDGSPDGQILAIMAERFALLWELAEAVNTVMDPDAAIGAALDSLCALTGTLRRAATASAVTLTLTGTPTTLVPSGSRASTESTGAEFATDANATVTLLTSWAAATPYTLGARRTNGGNAYVVIAAGTSAGSGGPTTDSDDITDGTVHWRFLGAGTGAIDADATAVETGPTVANSGDILEIETPVSGWNGVVNLLDADVGNAVESNEDLRVRRELELARAGTGPIDAVRADLLQVEGVSSVTVFHNPTDVTNGDGMPPHSVEALVTGGDEQEILDQLLASVAAGIATTGTTAGTSTDSQGIVHDVEFSRPDEVEIYVDLVLDVDAQLYPLDGDDQVIAAVVAAGDEYPTGLDVRASAVSAAAHTVPGVLGVTTVEIGTAPSPGASTTIGITLRQLAVFDTSRTTVVSNEVTP